MSTLPRQTHINLPRRLAALALGLGWMGVASGLELNAASEADLDSIKGIGPSTTARILAARQQQPFEGWQDLMRRVKGVAPATARRWAEQGMTVNGEPWPVATEQRADPPQKP